MRRGDLCCRHADRLPGHGVVARPAPMKDSGTRHGTRPCNGVGNEGLIPGAVRALARGRVAGPHPRATAPRTGVERLGQLLCRGWATGSWLNLRVGRETPRGEAGNVAIGGQGETVSVWAPTSGAPSGRPVPSEAFDPGRATPFSAPLIVMTNGWYPRMGIPADPADCQSSSRSDEVVYPTKHRQPAQPWFTINAGLHLPDRTPSDRRIGPRLVRAGRLDGLLRDEGSPERPAEGPLVPSAAPANLNPGTREDSTA